MGDVQATEASIAVVDAEGSFEGLIGADRMLEVLLTEHDEDLARIGGFPGSASARGARPRNRWGVVSTPPSVASDRPDRGDGLRAAGRRLRGGAPEEGPFCLLRARGVYMADAVGGRRGGPDPRALPLAWHSRSRFAHRRSSPGSSPVRPSSRLRCSAGATAASRQRSAWPCSRAVRSRPWSRWRPWLFQCFGADPAFGSGPLATVIQDLLSIAVYLAIAMPLAT